jgi:hypothetical protein
MPQTPEQQFAENNSATGNPAPGPTTGATPAAPPRRTWAAVAVVAVLLLLVLLVSSSGSQGTSAKAPGPYPYAPRISYDTAAPGPTVKNYDEHRVSPFYKAPGSKPRQLGSQFLDPGQDSLSYETPIPRPTVKGYYEPKVVPYPAGKPVHVNGYFRKNGTYVRPHFRSLPRR